MRAATILLHTSLRFKTSPLSFAFAITKPKSQKNLELEFSDILTKKN